MFYDTNGILLAPEKMSDLEKWPAPLRKIWDDAIDKEWDGLNGRSTFIHGVRKADFVKHGAPPNKVIGMRMLLDSKIKQGKFERAKGRTVAQGHKGNLRKGFDYDTVFCAAPALKQVNSSDNCVVWVDEMHI
jgi:hypothetical protein